MLTLKLFDALVGSPNTRIKDNELRTWARIEYKYDAEYAYNYMIEKGTAPNLGVKQ